MQRLKIGPIDILGCYEALQRLDDYVDRELSAQEQSKVRFHLRICRQCAKQFTFETDLDQGLKEKLARLDVPKSLKENVRRAWRD